MAIRVLLLADSHLGFDLPMRPRVQRRRRGHDFLANLDRALRPALAGEVDAVVHGGDVFDRSRVRPAVIEATPKSPSFTSPLLETKMLAGVTSR